MGACFNLRVEIGRHGLGIHVKNGMQQIRSPVEHLLYGREVLGGAAFDHVARQGEGRARKTDERHTVIEGLSNQTHRIRHILQLLGRIRHIKRLHVGFRPHGSGKHRTLPLYEGKPQPHRIRYRQNIRKKNRGIQSETIHRLQRHFASAFR